MIVEGIGSFSEGRCVEEAFWEVVCEGTTVVAWEASLESVEVSFDFGDRKPMVSVVRLDSRIELVRCVRGE